MALANKLFLGPLLLFCTVSGISQSHADARETILSKPLAQMKFEQSPEGVAFAPLVGDRFQESYMAMVRLPAGLVSPPHTKSANMFGILISGEMIHHPLNADPSSFVRLQAGSFYKIPANMPHISQCVSNVECVTFLHQDGKFDFKPVKSK